MRYASILKPLSSDWDYLDTVFVESHHAPFIGLAAFPHLCNFWYLPKLHSYTYFKAKLPGDVLLSKGRVTCKTSGFLDDLLRDNLPSSEFSLSWMTLPAHCSWFLLFFPPLTTASSSIWPYVVNISLHHASCLSSVILVLSSSLSIGTICHFSWYPPEIGQWWTSLLAILSSTRIC